MITEAERIACRRIAEAHYRADREAARASDVVLSAEWLADDLAEEGISYRDELADEIRRAYRELAEQRGRRSRR